MASILIFAARVSAQKTAVAVSEFRGEAIEESSARIITDRVRLDLVNSGIFRVIERSEMDNILREQGFQQSGACDDQTCLLEVGQILGVDCMIAGTIGKLGEMHTITLRMIDVKTGEITATAKKDCMCSIEEFMSQSIPAIVREISRKISASDTSSGAPAHTEASLHVTTEPPGARLSLDGTVMGTTPYSNARIAAGEYALRMDLDGYVTRNEAIRLEPGAVLELAYTLSQIQDTKRRHQPKRRPVVRRIIFGASTIIAAGIGYRLNQNAVKAYDRYGSLGPDDPAGEYNDAWDQVQTIKKQRNTAYIVAGLSAVCCAISFRF